MEFGLSGRPIMNAGFAVRMVVGYNTSMRRPKLYLETSVWNFLFADDAPDKRIATMQFFADVEDGKFEIFISETVEAEIMAAPDQKAALMIQEIQKYNPVILELDGEVRFLAEEYVRSGVLAQKHFNDLLHLAYATVHSMNALVSWNLNHLVKMKTHKLGNAVNLARGYHEILIFTPEEVIENED